jgi:plastocyanin
VARRGWTAAGVAIVMLILGACSSGGEQVPRKASSSAVDISVFSFKPSPIEVRRGETVRWSQRDNTMHTVTSGTPGSPDGRFRSDPLGEGETFSFTFQSAGTFAYFCSIHDSMRGEVRVT